MFGSKTYNNRYIFYNGVLRMIYDKEVTPKDYDLLSKICMYLSERPELLSDELNTENMYTSKDWEHGISNFCGKSFKELKNLFGKDAKQIYNEKARKIVESDIVSSNGYIKEDTEEGITAYLACGKNQARDLFSTGTFIRHANPNNRYKGRYVFYTTDGAAYRANYQNPGWVIVKVILHGNYEVVGNGAILTDSIEGIEPIEVVKEIQKRIHSNW